MVTIYKMRSWFTPLTLLILMLGLAASEAEPDAGAFLSASVAAHSFEYDLAQEFISKALEADPDEIEVLQLALPVFLAAGKTDAAIDIAIRFDNTEYHDGLVGLVLLAHAFRSQDYSRILNEFDSFNLEFPVLKLLSPAWAAFAQGDVDTAMEHFNNIAPGSPFNQIMNFNKTLALYLAGDIQGAREAFESGEPYGTELGPEIELVRALLHANLGEPDLALEALRNIPQVDANPRYVLSRVLKEYILAGKPIDFSFVDSADHAFSKVFLTFARYVQSTEPSERALLYTRLAEILSPGDDAVHILAGEILLDLGNPGMAIAEFSKIPSSSRLHTIAAIGRARSHERNDELDDSIKLLSELASQHPDSPTVYYQLGDVFRYNSRFEEAVEAYDSAVERSQRLNEIPWGLLYSRAIANERLGNWTAAEADFRQALVDSNSNPYVLNYLGYVLADRGEKLPEAEQLIRDAVAADPENGYFLDSLGWVLYRLKRYDEAMEPLEKAARILHTSTEVIDHLGDLYWVIGRKRDAEFQWRRALSFEEEMDGQHERIRKKLEVGLDQYLLEQESIDTDAN